MANPQKENGYTPIADEIMEALIRYRIPGEQMQCLLFIIRKTYGFNKIWDMISNSQFVDATGLKKSSVCRAIKGLIDKNIVSKNANNYIPKYRFNKNYRTWKVLAKKITVSKKVNKGVTKKRPTKDTITKEKITYPIFLDKDIWSEYKKMRIKIKATMTPYAEKLAINKLGRFIEQGYNPTDIINQSIMNSWKGLFPLKDVDPTPPVKRRSQQDQNIELERDK